MRFRPCTLLLAASIAINCVGAAYGFHRMLRSQSNQHAYAAARTSQLAGLAIASNALVFVGDSLTDWGEWAELVPGQRALNRGVAGDTLDELQARIAPVLRARPRVVAIMIGVNDLAKRRSPAQVAASYERLLHRIRKETPKSTVLVQSVLPVNKALYDGRVENGDIVELNRRLRALARATGCRFVDVASALANEAGELDEKLTLDGLHLNGAGYRRWAAALQPGL